MSATITFPIIPQAGTWTLGSSLRNITDANSNAVRIELAPQSALTDAEFDTTQAWSSGASLGSWSILNNGNLTTLDENTTQKSGMYCKLAASGTSLDFDNGTHSAPVIYQTITGDFDVFSIANFGEGYSYAFCGLIALLDGSPSNSFNVSRVCNPANSGGAGGVQTVVIGVKSITSGSNTYSVSVVTGADLFNQGRLFVRLKKSGSSFSAYVSSDSATWTQVGATQTRTDLNGQTLDLGVAYGKPDNSSTLTFTGWADFIRNTNPYSTTASTNEEASVVIDSGVNGTTWTMSTFQDYLYPQIDSAWAPYFQAGLGSLTYDYGASDTSPPSLTGTYRTTSSMQAQSNPTGRYFKLSVKFTSSHGYDLASFSGATIQGVVTTSGGAGNPVGQCCQ